MDFMSHLESKGTTNQEMINYLLGFQTVFANIWPQPAPFYKVIPGENPILQGQLDKAF